MSPISKEKIIKIRKELGLSQEKFASMLGETRGVITNLERGLTILSEIKINNFCRLLNVNKEWLLKDGDDNTLPIFNTSICDYNLAISNLTPNEKIFIDNFLSLNPTERQSFITILNKLQ